MGNRDEIILKDLGKKLREIRKEKGLTQEELANDANIPINQVGRIERGEINTTVLTLSVLSKVLEIDLKDFF